MYDLRISDLGDSRPNNSNSSCRAFQTIFRLALPFLPYREPEALDTVEPTRATFTASPTRSAVSTASPTAWQTRWCAPYMCEVGLTLSEIGYQLGHVRRWAKPQRVAADLANFHASCFTLAEPYGVALVMSPWNYPFMLTMEPLAGGRRGGQLLRGQAERLLAGDLAHHRRAGGRGV